MGKVLWHSTLGAKPPKGSYPTTQFRDSAPPPSPSGGMPLPASLSQDIARTFRQLGIASFRASVVNIDSMAFQAAWTISEEGEVTDNHIDRPLDSSFPAATAAINLLAHASDEETLVHKLSPRRWGIAWRLDDPHVVLAEAHFLERRDTVNEPDKILLRLVCSAAMRPYGKASAAGLEATPGSIVWNRNDTAAAAPPLGLSKLALAMGLGASLLAGWLAFVTVPELQRNGSQRAAQITELRGLADKTLARGMSDSMAAGDYGDVQTALASFSSLGYFEGAAVINMRQRVVALSGKTDQLRIGDAVPEAMQKSAAVVELEQGGERLGRVFILPAPAPAASAALPAVVAPLAMGAAGFAVLGTLATLLALRRRKPDAA